MESIGGHMRGRDGGEFQWRADEDTGHAGKAPLRTVLARLRTILDAQAEALAAEDFDGLERLYAEREQLIAALSAYEPADLGPEDRALLEQVSALDQRLLALVRESLDRTARELREVHRGRGALNEYGQRGQMLIRNLQHLDTER